MNSTEEGRQMMKSMTGAAALAKLADMLLMAADRVEKIDASLSSIFNMGGWGTVPKDIAFADDRPKDLHLNCRTAACALGYAALSGEFESLGLRWRAGDVHNGTVFLDIYSVNAKAQDEREDPIVAAIDVFGITAAEALWLFAPSTREWNLYKDFYDAADDYIGVEYTGPAAMRQEAKRINAFLAKGGIPDHG